jgi:hypothetical protein
VVMTFSTTALWRFVKLTESFAFIYSPMDTSDTLNYMVAEDGMKTWLSFFSRWSIGKADCRSIIH